MRFFPPRKANHQDEDECDRMSLPGAPPVRASGVNLRRKVRGGQGLSADQLIEATQWTGIEQRPHPEDAEDQEQTQDNEHEGDVRTFTGAPPPWGRRRKPMSVARTWSARAGAAVLELRAPELEAPAPRRPYRFGLVSFISCFSLWRFSTLPSGATLT
jgi:hypothetical protein